MPKTKKITKKKISPRFWLYTALTIAIVVASWLYLRAQTQLATIAEIDSSTTDLKPQISEEGCISNLQKISFENECSPGKFSSATYTCSSGETSRRGNSTSCYDHRELIADISRACGYTCPSVPPTPLASAPSRSPQPTVQPYPTPVPSRSPVPTVTPTPTSTPIPSVPAGKCISPLKSVTYSNHEFNCPSGQANFGNYTCNDGYTGQVGDTTLCQSNSELEALAKSRCGSPHDCVLEQPNPNRSPSPTTPGCYYESTFCISRIFGGTCPERIICPTPTPTPAPVRTPAPPPTTGGAVDPVTQDLTTVPLSPSASPTNVEAPAPVRRSFSACYQACRQDKGSFFSCVRRCLR